MSETDNEAARSKIVLLNDDLTPMEFVVAILEDYFQMSREQATSAMLHTHRRGTYSVATMDKAKAEITVALIHEQARRAGHPFRCVLETEA